MEGNCRRPALIVLLATLLISACQAGNSQPPKPVQNDVDSEWRLAFVTSDYAWHMSEAQGALKRDGNQLSGVLVNPKDSNEKFEVAITLNADKTTARFKISPEVDEQFLSASGTYRKLSPAGAKGCVEQINLINDHEFVGLFRDYDCKP
jgi:hypothetical protein